MTTNKKPVTLVFRKSNPGNFSIETVYNTLLDFFTDWQDATVELQRITLKSNFDFKTFLQCVLKSLRGKIKIAHITGGCNYMVLAFPRSKRILTVHDLFYLTHKNSKKGWLYKFIYYTLPIGYSTKIVAVSEQTKSELIRLFPKSESKITVIHNPISLGNTTKNQQAGTPKKTDPLVILQIGSKPLKNYKNLLLATRDLNVNYIFIHGDTGPINSYLEEFNLSHKANVFTNVTKEQLTTLYAKAHVLFFASKAEGFGLPLLEAQAMRLPIITSNFPPMKTLAPQAILVDPNSIQQINQAVKTIINKGYAAELLDEGIQNVKAFTVSRIAAEYQKLYSNLG